MRSLARQDFIARRLRGYGRGRGRPEELILLTDEGTEFLRDEGILSESTLPNVGSTVDLFRVDHDLLVNWFRIHLIQIEKVIPQISIHYLGPNFHRFSSKCGDGPFLREHVPVENTPDKTSEFIPDGVFSITYKDTETKKSLLFFLEVDMGTETIASTDPNPKDIRHKILNYQSLFRTGRYKRYEKILDSKFNGFRLLFLANTLARVSALCRLAEEMPPSDFVWLTDQKRMFSYGVSAEIWVRGGRNVDSLHSILGPKLASEAPVCGTPR